MRYSKFTIGQRVWCLDFRPYDSSDPTYKSIVSGVVRSITWEPNLYKGPDYILRICHCPAPCRALPDHWCSGFDHTGTPFQEYETYSSFEEMSSILKTYLEGIFI